MSGRFHLDFKNPDALRALTCTLLKKDFNLDVEIPVNRLIPTVPLRLNYILWLEDLLSAIGENAEISGLDIGIQGMQFVLSLQFYVVFITMSNCRNWHLLHLPSARRKKKRLEIRGHRNRCGGL